MIEPKEKKKRCSKCKKLKVISEYSPSKTGKYGVYNYCKVCHSEMEKAKAPNRQWIDDSKGLKVQGLKRCRSCSMVKVLNEDFYDDPRHKDGKQSQCKECISFKLKAGHLAKNFGITTQEYLYMLEFQKGVCAICKRASKRNLSVDHDHMTHKIRGLLCTNCNSRILPVIEDSRQWVENALDYLHTPPATFVLEDKEIPENSQFRKTRKGAPLIAFKH